jgi:hypothetical protein
MALVLPVAQLPDQYHDSIMTLVETDQAQDAFEFGEIMHIRPFQDGRPMLLAMQADNRLVKVATDTVMMTPTTNDTVLLANLNTLIAEQKNCIPSSARDVGVKPTLRGFGDLNDIPSVSRIFRKTNNLPTLLEHNELV